MSSSFLAAEQTLIQTTDITEECSMKILVVGLGLIGGSMCKAMKKYTYHTVTG